MTRDKNKLIGVIIVFLIGFSVIVYPLISRTYYDFQGSQEVQDYEEELSKITAAEVEKQLQSAYAYNNALLTGENSPLGDPYNKEEKEQGVLDYVKLLEISG
ncbi:MAG: hypothetical protein RR649_06835, partial [Carnobacterium sp.]